MNALLLLNLQVDYGPSGAIHTHDSLEVVRLANALMPHFDNVIASQEWHPANHVSFAANHWWRKPGQVMDLEGQPLLLWPMHCVQETFGADWLPGLNLAPVERIFHIGTDPLQENFSAFFNNRDMEPSGLEAYLKDQGITELAILGFATEYAVRETAMDAQTFGFQPVVFLDAIRPANLEKDREAEALTSMEAAGISLQRAADWLPS